LAQHTGERADLELTVHWYYAALGFATHDDVAATLADLRKPKTLKRADDLSS